MRNKILTIAVIGFTAAVIYTGCQNAGEKRLQDAQEGVGQTKPDTQTVQSSYSDDWQKFKSESEQKIDNNEASIAAFKEKMKRSGTKIKAKYNEEIANLEEANRGMKKKLIEYKNDGKTAWLEFKTGFNNDMDKLDKSLKDLTSDND